MRPQTSDKNIRAVLLNSIANEALMNRQKHRVVQEMGICRGVARIDIAVIKHSIHGYEIKSDKDSLTRLPNQINQYNKVFDYLTLVSGSNHIEKVRDIVPNWWGLSEAKTDNDQTTLMTIRQPKRNPLMKFSSLLELLWKEELIGLIKEIGIEKKVSGKNRQYLMDLLISESNHIHVTNLARSKLYLRKDWRQGDSH